jgi:ubiquinol-cytochrome c reductase cytochrome c1 subunit
MVTCSTGLRPSDSLPAAVPQCGRLPLPQQWCCAPPDFSLIAKARGVTRGFPQFVFDIFTQYQEGGPDYIYSLLTAMTRAAGRHRGSGRNATITRTSLRRHRLPWPSRSRMARSPMTMALLQTLDQYAKDVSAFLMWAAEPHLEDRKRTGFMVMVFLLIFTALVYLTKRSLVYATSRNTEKTLGYNKKRRAPQGRPFCWRHY